MKRFLTLLIVAATAGLSVAANAADPTLHEVYQAVHEGRLNDAQSMMTQVLHDHPNSAKAHYVEAEVLVRMGRAGDAQDELGQAERLEPGLPFARPDSVRSLRAMIAQRAGGAPVVVAPGSAPQPHFPWGIILIVGGAALLLVVYFRSQRSRPVVVVQGGPGAGPMGGGYPSPGYGGGPYPTGGGGLGSGIVGGLATGAALGAGMVAGEALANDLMGHHGSGAASSPFVDNGQQPAAFDGGGNDFGVADSGSWDDSSDLAGGDGGGDWS